MSEERKEVKTTHTNLQPPPPKPFSHQVLQKSNYAMCSIMNPQKSIYRFIFNGFTQTFLGLLVLHLIIWLSNNWFTPQSILCLYQPCSHKAKPPQARLLIVFLNRCYPNFRLMYAFFILYLVCTLIYHNILIFATVSLIAYSPSDYLYRPTFYSIVHATLKSYG